jgi:hypothetical protein
MSALKFVNRAVVACDIFVGRVCQVLVVVLSPYATTCNRRFTFFGPIYQGSVPCDGSSEPGLKKKFKKGIDIFWEGSYFLFSYWVLTQLIDHYAPWPFRKRKRQG